jgi:NAD(P)-dependent dehydrogenase (short-subunit alcohol dehydrogenase family)
MSHGAAIGRGLQAAGARVTVTGATDGEMESARGAPGFGAQHAVRLDVTDDAAVKALILGFDRLDIVVNCAGIIRRGDEHAIPRSSSRW